MKHKREYQIFVLIFLISGVLFLTACLSVSDGPGRHEPTVVSALITPTTPATAEVTASATTAATATTAVTATPTATEVVVTQPTAVGDTCTDAATFITDVTVPDGTSFAPRTGFNKTWRLRNSGTCTWDNRYKLIHAGGHRLGAIAADFSLPGSVSPGQTVDLSVSLVSPAEPDIYQGDWKLQNPQGQPFGIGQNHNGPVWVKIMVERPQPKNNGRISGFAWQDQDFDNQVEESEFLANVSITLAAGANCGTAMGSTVTNSSGRFSFDNLFAGDYCLIGSDGSVTVSQSNLVLTENQQLVDVNVTWPPVWPEPAAISGWVWDDYCAVDIVDGAPVILGHCVDNVNGGYVADGMIQPEETTIAGVTVKLVHGSCVGDALPVQLTAVTDNQGRYRFEGLQPGVYCVFIDAVEANNAAILQSGIMTFPAYAIGFHEIMVQAGDEANPVNFGWDFAEAGN